ncbi:MAG: ATP-binding protein [Verrucomicrobia bacterium]|nr:ATP-binding protein [Verrucomicrobiota bacterium]
MHLLRIAIDGAQSTGKTTLWSQLQDRYGNQFSFVPEASRHIAKRFAVNTATDWQPLLANKDRLRSFFEQEEEWQVEQEIKVPFIADSSLFLIQAYRITFGVPTNDSVLSTAKYDLVLYCPPVSNFVADGFRFETQRDRVDQAYREITRSYFRGRLVELPTNGARLEQAVAAIDKQAT